LLGVAAARSPVPLIAARWRVVARGLAVGCVVPSMIWRRPSIRRQRISVTDPRCRRVGTDLRVGGTTAIAPSAIAPRVFGVLQGFTAFSA